MVVTKKTAYERYEKKSEGGVYLELFVGLLVVTNEALKMLCAGDELGVALHVLYQRGNLTLGLLSRIFLELFI